MQSKQKNCSPNCNSNFYPTNNLITPTLKLTLNGLSPRATAACRRSQCQLLRIESVAWSARRIPRQCSRFLDRKLPQLASKYPTKDSGKRPPKQSTSDQPTDWPTNQSASLPAKESINPRMMDDG
jgi:hypothetical protein